MSPHADAPYMMKSATEVADETMSRAVPCRRSNPFWSFFFCSSEEGAHPMAAAAAAAAVAAALRIATLATFI